MEASRSTDEEPETLPTTAILRFRHRRGSWSGATAMTRGHRSMGRQMILTPPPTRSRSSRHGRVRPDGRLIVEYDPARLTQGGNAPASSTDILCHVRFPASWPDPQRERVGACSSGRRYEWITTSRPVGGPRASGDDRGRAVV